jgi:site-specific recombinase XerD
LRIFNRVINRAKIPRVDAEGGKIDIHALRHTFASRLCRSGVGLVHAQNLLGHSDPRLTAAIIHAP